MNLSNLKALTPTHEVKIIQPINDLLNPYRYTVMAEQGQYQHYVTVCCFKNTYLDPKFFIQCTGNETPFKEDNNPFLVTLFNFIIQILFPILQLAAFQGFHMEIWSLDLFT
jgi:hypothetical protein